MNSPPADRFDAGNGMLVECSFSSPAQPRAVLVFGHGAGADMRHANMVALSDAFTAADVLVMRFNFPFMQQGRRRVDAKAVSTGTIAAAATLARAERPDLPLLLGGHSYGGRMASHAIADESLTEVSGLIFGSFPLHPAGKPGLDRAAHLPAIGLPMLFLSGTRDALAEQSLMTPMVAALGSRTRLHWLDTADHGYKTLKRSRQSEVGVFAEMGQILNDFLNEMLASPTVR